MPGDHQLAKRRTITFTDLARQPLILWSEAGPLWPYLTAALKAHNVTASPRAMTNSLDMMKLLVRAGIGVGLFSRFGFERDIEAGHLAHVPFRESFLADRRIGVFIPANRRLSTGASLFVEHLRQAFAQL